MMNCPAGDGHTPQYLGHLGTKVFYRCRDCGLEYFDSNGREELPPTDEERREMVEGDDWGDILDREEEEYDEWIANIS